VIYWRLPQSVSKDSKTNFVQEFHPWPEPPLDLNNCAGFFDSVRVLKSICREDLQSSVAVVYTSFVKRKGRGRGGGGSETITMTEKRDSLDLRGGCRCSLTPIGRLG
jgi:hypothetical protein